MSKRGNDRMALLEAFVFRRPLGRWSDSQMQINGDIVEEFFRNDALQKAVAFASPEFFERLLKKRRENRFEDKDIEKLESFCKRFGSRSTPFGFFAATGVGRFKSARETHLNTTEATHHFRSLRLRPSSLLKANPTLFVRGNRCRYLKTKPSRLAEVALERVEISKALGEILQNLPPEIEARKLETLFVRKLRMSGPEARGLIAQLVHQQLFLEIPDVVEESWINPSLEKIHHLRSDGTRLAQGVSLWKDELHLPSEPFERALRALSLLRRLPPRQTQASVLARVEVFLRANSQRRSFPLLALTWELLPDGTHAQNPAHRSLELFLQDKRVELIRDGIRVWRISASGEELRAHLVPDTAPPTVTSFYSALIPQPAGPPKMILGGALTRSATRPIGRFANWHPAIGTLARDVQQREALSHGSDAVVCGLIPAARDHTYRAVQCFEHSFPHSINCSTFHAPNEISLRDVHVMIDETERLRLISKTTGRTVVPYLLDMVNYEYDMHLPYRILCALADQGQIPSSLVWPMPGAGLHFMPGIEIGGAILFKPSWFLNDPERKRGDDELIREVRQACPRWVQLAQADMKLPLDLERPRDVRLLMRELRKYGNVRLEEPIPGEFESSIEVIAFATPAETGSAIASRRRPSDLNPSWSSSYCQYNLYADPTDFDEILLALRSFFARHRVSDWFFIRYKDSMPHLRIRFRSRARARTTVLQAELETRLRAWLDDLLLVRWEQHVFDPEWTRYLGHEGMRLYARTSHEDTRGTLNVLAFTASHGIPATDAFLQSFLDQKLRFWLEIWCRKSDERIALVDSFLKASKAFRATDRPARTDAGVVLSEDTFRQLYAACVSVPGHRRDIKRLAHFGKERVNSVIHSLVHMNFNRCHSPLPRWRERQAYEHCLQDYYRRKSLSWD